MLALIGTASYLFLVHRLADSFHTSYPRSVTLTQLYFPLLAVVSSQEDFHLQDRTHAGRTTLSPGIKPGVSGLWHPWHRPSAGLACAKRRLRCED